MDNNIISKYKPTLDDVMKLVQTNDKKRFEVKTDPFSEEVTLEN